MIILKLLRYAVRESGTTKTGQLAAFAGVMDEDTVPNVGIGLMDEDGYVAEFYGLRSSHNVVTAYRGAQILSKVYWLDPGTVRACYYAGARMLGEQETRYVSELEASSPKMAELRELLLVQPIGDDELERVLKLCNSLNNRVCPSVRELRAEIKHGIITRTSQVKWIFDAERAEAERWARSSRFCKNITLPRGQSFRRFCEDFGVKYLCAPTLEDGADDMDWRPVDLSSLDESIVMDGLHYHRAKEIFCTERRPRSSQVLDVGRPVLTMRTGELLVLESVEYIHRVMHANLTSTCCQNGRRRQVTLTALRGMTRGMEGIATTYGGDNGGSRYYVYSPLCRKDPLGTGRFRRLLARIFGR